MPDIDPELSKHGACQSCAQAPATLLAVFDVLNAPEGAQCKMKVCQQCLADAQTAILLGLTTTEAGWMVKLSHYECL